MTSQKTPRKPGSFDVRGRRSFERINKDRVPSNAFCAENARKIYTNRREYDIIRYI